ncbi:MAG: hypothetical protein ACTHK8_02770 [Ginsengibacter sp.]
MRGVKAILTACIDNLKGFAEAIATVFMQTGSKELHRTSNPQFFKIGSM